MALTSRTTALSCSLVSLVAANTLVARNDCWVNTTQSCCGSSPPSGPQPNLIGRDCDNNAETPPICPDDPISDPQIDKVQPAGPGQEGRTGVDYGATANCKRRVWARPTSPGGPCVGTGVERSNSCNTSKTDPNSAPCVGQQD